MILTQGHLPIVALWRHIAIEILVNIGSNNGLLPDGTKPLPLFNIV